MWNPLFVYVRCCEIYLIFILSDFIFCFTRFLDHSQVAMFVKLSSFRTLFFRNSLLISGILSPGLSGWQVIVFPTSGHCSSMAFQYCHSSWEPLITSFIMQQFLKDIVQFSLVEYKLGSHLTSDLQASGYCLLFY